VVRGLVLSRNREIEQRMMALTANLAALVAGAARQGMRLTQAIDASFSSADYILALVTVQPQEKWTATQNVVAATVITRVFRTP